MPKIIENLRERLLAEARLQVNQLGYGQITVRGIASACGVGVGTVYNYFPSKEHLIAAFMMEDWNIALSEMLIAPESGDARSLLHSEYKGLSSFVHSHQKLFSDPDAIRIFSSVARDRHPMLRRQLSEPLEKILSDSGKANASFLAVFLTESLMTWCLAGVSKEELFSVLDPLL